MSYHIWTHMNLILIYSVRIPTKNHIIVHPNFQPILKPSTDDSKLKYLNHTTKKKKNIVTNNIKYDE